MNYAISYLEKHTKGNSYIKAKPVAGLKYIVTIPAYLETSLIESLVSLFSCTPPASPVETIIVFNWPENETSENISLSKRIIANTISWIDNHIADWISFHFIILPNVPKRIAGVGYARKTGMDEAIRRFIQAGQKDGIILSFDGDSICDTNYFISIESHFLQNHDTDGCSIYFEHPYEGDIFPEIVYKGIVEYELHLRYYLNCLRNTGFPNAFYTVGSAFAIRASSYCKQGGMNTRKAGEDFYFLQKFFDLGTFSELNTTRVIPSPRPSSRVPFGTGASITNFMQGENVILSYNPYSFEILKRFFEILPNLFDDNCVHLINKIDATLGFFLENCGFYLSLEEIRQNSSDYNSFRKRFFRYFNMFRILKFLNYAKLNYPDLPILKCAEIYLKKEGNNEIVNNDSKILLEIFRHSDRKIIFPR